MTDKPLWDQLVEIGASKPEAWETPDKITIERETLQQALEALEASLPAHHFRDMPRRGKSLAAISTLRAALAAPAAEPTGFDRTTALVLLSAASKSGDPGAISLAAQLAGAAPCKDCGFVNFKCRCAAPPAPPAPAAVPLLTDAQVDAISMGLFGCINAAYRKQITDAVLSSGGGGITCATKRTVAQVRTATSAAPAAVPLTDEQILEIAEPFGCFQYGDAQGHKRIEFARAVLAAGDKP